MGRIVSIFSGDRVDALMVATFVIAILFTLCCLHHQAPHKQSAESITSSTRELIERNRALVKCQNFCEHFESSIRNALKARALPNRRLVHVFGIDNPFTSDSEDVRTHYHRLAAGLLSPDWGRLAEKSRALVRSAIHKQVRICDQPSSYGEPAFALAPVVQGLTLKVALEVLFSIDSMSLDDEAVDTVAREINRLWVASKDDYEAVPSFPWQHDLRSALRTLLPNRSLEPDENPLNLILPAYETMWRVVLLGYLEARHHTFGAGRKARSRMLHADSLCALQDFLDHPDMRLRTEGDRVGFTAIHIAREALRLYPSTKSIYRSGRCEVCSGRDQNYRADIEAMHRVPHIWEETSSCTHQRNAQCFDPLRWAKLKPEGPEGAYIPFGIGVFTCPAKRDFGERMIALLIAAVADATSSYHIQSELLHKASALPSGRQDLKHWELVHHTHLENSPKAQCTS